MPLLVLSAAQVRVALPMPAAIAAMRVAFGQLARGEAELPLRTVVRVPGQDGVMLVMPARTELPLGLGGKLVSVFPRNPQRGTPLVHAAVVLLSAETGELRAVVEGTSLTAIRTGAASGLATDLLARPDASRVAVIGAGVQARTQLEAVCCVRRVEAVRVYSRTRGHAERLAREMAGVGRVPTRVVVAPSAAEAAAGADVVCTATSSSEPVLRADDVGPGTHVNAVGSFTPAMRELDAALLSQAQVVVDQREAALAEAGEVIGAVEAGALSREALVELGEVVVGRAAGRTAEAEITLFKSVGLAVQDLVAAGQAVGEAQQRGLGVSVEL